MRQSGQTQAQWCKEHDISLNSLRQWIKTFNREKRQNKGPEWLKFETGQDPLTGKLILPGTTADLPQMPFPAAEISVTCGTITVRLPLTAAPEQIAQIIVVLKAS